VRVRYTDFTSGTDAYTCEAWAVAGEYNSTEETWLPRVVVRHHPAAQSKASTTLAAPNVLETTFVSVIEPYDQKTGHLIKAARRLGLKQGEKDAGDSSVALALELADGKSDVWVSNGSAGTVAQGELHFSTDARLAMVRRDTGGRPMLVSICQGSKLVAGTLKVTLNATASFVQFRLNPDGSVTLLAGKPEQVGAIEIDEKPMKFEAKP
jgi:hypothetical protein